MDRSRRPVRAWTEAPPLRGILELALLLRVAAALCVDWYVHRGGGGGGGAARICVFPDARYYWALAETIRTAAPYEIVEWGDIPHFALRTPGYPMFLALCQLVTGGRTLGVRLAQAGLGALSVWLVFRLSRAVLEAGPDGAAGAGAGAAGGEGADRGRWTVPLAAALLAAIHPYFVVMPALILSEAVFVPLSLGGLWLMAALWRGEEGRPPRARRELGLALGVGALGGAAVLVRPSWLLFVPAALAAWGCARLGARGRSGLPGVLGVLGAAALGCALVMSPWWARNARIYGRFIPTAVWMGASLYDGLNPRASGASDMSFLADPEIWPRSELGQDRELTRRALEFAVRRPARAGALAVIKLGRFWSPWPNAEGLRSPALAAACALFMAPLFGLLGLGLWRRRAELRVWVLLAGPLLYFCALHMVFASSMRYRIPAEFPAMGLAAAGLPRGGRVKE